MEDPTATDWVAWHQGYERADSGLTWRLGVVQRAIAEALDAQPEGPIGVISLCAGQGRDLIGVLPGHPRRDDVRARLVELDPANAARARADAAGAGLGALEVVEADAGDTSACAGAVPAGLILACGIFGNISEAYIASTIAGLSQLAAPAATVIWTRHTKAPDLTGDIRAWWREAGWEELSFQVRPKGVQSVGVNRLAVAPAPFAPGRRLFRFREYG